MVVPCVSPWAYEVVHRWNPRAIDPNRSIAPYRDKVEDPQSEFQQAIIAAVATITPIACADRNGARELRTALTAICLLAQFETVYFE